MELFIILLFLFILYSIFRKKNPDSVAFKKKSNEDKTGRIYWDYNSSVPCEASLEIEYSDAQGVITNRKVDIDRCIFGRSDSMFTGYCHLRGEVRSFRVSRVYHAVDCGTGEVIRNVSRYLEQKYKSSPHAVLAEVFSEYGDQINILFYIGKLDNQLRKPERDIIYSYIKNVIGGDQIEEQLLKKYVDRLVLLSADEFRSAVEKVATLDKEKIDIIFRAVSDMYETKKTHRTEEVAAMEYIKKEFYR